MEKKNKIEARKMDAELKEALIRLANEHNYFIDLKIDLENLSRDIKLAKNSSFGADIKKALRDFGFIMKSEERFSTIEEHVEDAMAKMIAQEEDGEAKKATKLYTDMESEADFLLRNSADHEGHIIKLLKRLKDCDPRQEYYAKLLCLEIEQTVQEALEWIDALTSDLEKAEEMHDQFNARVKDMLDSETHLLNWGDKKQ